MEAAFSSPSPSPAPSFGDLRSQDGQQRIRRKPPPVREGALTPLLLQEREERYPTPDPTDPFAPLWVLRKRTSSAPLRATNDSHDTLDTILQNDRTLVDAAPGNKLSSRTTSPNPSSQYTPYSQQHAFPRLGSPVFRADTPHIFTSPASSRQTPLRMGPDDDEESDVSASSMSLVFRPVFSNDSFERTYTKQPSSERRELAPGVQLNTAIPDARSKLTMSPIPSTTGARQRFAQLKSLLRPMSKGKRSMSVSISSATFDNSLPRPTGANFDGSAKTTSRLPSQRPAHVPVLVRFQKQVSITGPPNSDTKENQIPQAENRNSDRKSSKEIGSVAQSQRRHGNQLQNQYRSLSMGAVISSSAPERETVMVSKTEPRIACAGFTFAPGVAKTLSQGAIPTPQNTTENSCFGIDFPNGSPAVATTATSDGFYHSHGHIIDDSKPRTKTGTTPDLLPLGIKANDYDQRPGPTQEGPVIRPPTKVEDSSHTSMPHTNRPAVTFAPPKPPEPRKSAKPSMLASVFTTTATLSRPTVTRATASVSAKDSISANSSTVTTSITAMPPLRPKRSKLSSLSSASSSSLGSMVFANPDYVAPPQALHTQKISSPELLPLFEHTICAETFVSPRPAPVPPKSLPVPRTPTSPISVIYPQTTSFGPPFRDVSYGREKPVQPLEENDACHMESRCGESGDSNVFPSRFSDDKIPSQSRKDMPPGEWVLPTAAQLSMVSKMPVKGEDGGSVQFGSLFTTHRTIVVFIRHFWCPLCQDYMASLRALVKPEMLARPKDPAHRQTKPSQSSRRDSSPAALRRSIDDGVDGEQTEEQQLVGFVVIGNGAHAMIKKYRQIFGLPFAVYTDPSLNLYRALGMGRDGDDGHRHLTEGTSAAKNQRSRRASLSGIPREPSTGPIAHSEKQSKNSKGYVKHSLVGGIAMVVVRAIKVGMPVWEKGGDIAQLGGEFIFGPGLKCSFAHRMQTTKGHAPIEDVLEAAGVDVSSVLPSSDTSGRQRRSSLHEPSKAHYKRATLIRRGESDRPYSAGIMSREDEEVWMAQRQQQLDALHQRKLARRGVRGRAVDTEKNNEETHGHVLEAVGEVSEEVFVEDDENYEDRRYSMDTAGGDADDENDTLEDEKSQNDILMEEIHRRLRSMTDHCGSVDGEGSDTDTEGVRDNDDWPIPRATRPQLI